jgi:hypothetical protein
MAKRKSCMLYYLENNNKKEFAHIQYGHNFF